MIALRDLVLQEFLEPPFRGGQRHPVGDHAGRGAGLFLGIAAEARARRGRQGTVAFSHGTAS